MKQKQMFEEIRSFCIENGEEEIRGKYAKFFKEGYDSYGLSNVNFNILLKNLNENYIRSSDIKKILTTGDELIGSGKYEEASLAISFIIYKRKELIRNIRKRLSADTGESLSQFDAVVFSRLKSWFDNGIRNWAHSDYTCSELLGRFLIDGTVQLNDLYAWRSSSSKWTRRAVPVSMISLLKRDQNPEYLLKFFDQMMLEEERPVRQGLGWFLREMWKRYPEEVENFLLKWKETAPRLIFQYATEKMDKDLKERFRRSKKR